MNSTSPARGVSRAWVGLVIALAAHVADEALTGFLEAYNPLVIAARQRFGWFPMPTFTFGVWLSGLTAAVVVLLALTPVIRRGGRFSSIAPYPFALVMLLNGVGHLAASVYFGRWMPGSTTAALLIVTSVWLLRCTHVRRSSR